MSDYRHCVTENAVDRQRQFENALLELMETKTLPQISIQEICSRVGLSRKSFYRYFSSKEACLHALVDHAILNFTDIPFQNDRAQELLERFFLYWMHRRKLLDALCRSDMVGVLLNWQQEGFQRSPAQLAQTLGAYLPQYPRGIFG